MVNVFGNYLGNLNGEIRSFNNLIGFEERAFQSNC